MFKKAFKWLSNNIIPNESINNSLIYFYPLRKNRVKVNASIDVPVGFQVVVVLNGKITDIISSGKHKVNGSTMPETFQKLKLGKANKKGNYKRYFKARVFYVNLKMLTNFTYTSSVPFYIKSDKFGKIKGFCEGTCNVIVDSSEYVVTYLLNNVSKLKPNKIQDQISQLIGNAVKTVLEKSKLHFSDILLRPEKLEIYLNPAVSNITREFGITVEEAKLHSLQLTKKIQEKVNLFLSNRSNFDLNDNFSVTINNEEDNLLSNNNFKIENNNELVKQEHITSVNNKQTYEELEKQESSETVHENVVPNSLFKRRLSSENLIDANQTGNSDISIPNINTNEILTNNSNALKQCKFCNSTIEMHFKFCPKCGFKQIQ